MGLKLLALGLSVLLISTPVTAQERDLESLARRVVAVGVHDPEATDALEHIRAGGGGVVLFGGAIADRAGLRRLTNRLHCAANQPLIVSVDEEPGAVGRLDGLITPLPDPWGVEPEAMELAAGTLARELLQLGITLDLAPVADVDIFGSRVLRGRAFGSSPETVSAPTESFVSGFVGQHVGTTLKHFPGHGATPADTHRGPTVVNDPLPALRENHLPPFLSGIAAGADAVMFNHVTYTALDPTRPASLSTAAYDLLRSTGFDGLAVTDGLAMGAVRPFGSIPEVAVEMLVAGADLLLVEDASIAEAVTGAILEAIASGRLPIRRLADAASRVGAFAGSVAWPGCVGPGLPALGLR